MEQQYREVPVVHEHSAIVHAHRCSLPSPPATLAQECLQCSWRFRRDYLSGVEDKFTVTIKQNSETL